MKPELPAHQSIALPSKSLLKQKLPGEDFEFKYVNCDWTDIRELFNRFRAEQAKPARGLREVSKQR